MAPPVSRSQNTYSANAVQPSMQIHARVSVSSQDILTRANAAASESLSFSTLWDSIVDCFKSIFGYFLKPSQKDRIAEIAARDHFVWFYNEKENSTTAFLDNSYPCKIKIWDDLQFECAEAAFQAAKFLSNPADMKRFEKLSGEQARTLGENLSRDWVDSERIHWNSRHLSIMKMTIWTKFRQNEELQELLFSTDNAYLVQHTPEDRREGYWGDNSDGTGNNWLGQLVMEVRYELGGGGIELNAAQEYQRFIAGRRS